MNAYLRPGRLGEALDALQSGTMTVLAGGTDHYPARLDPEPGEDILDITGIDGLRAIEAGETHWRIPALARWSDLIRAELPPLFDGLKQAAREIGGVQVQNAGTLCGNLCNASPAADGVPVLICLDALVELSASRGVEVMAVEDFILGNRRTVLTPDQLMTAVLVPRPVRASSAGHFRKLGSRAYMVISIVMVAAVLEADERGDVSRARVAVGACGEVARRLPALEAALVGRPARDGPGDVASTVHLAPLAPIDDVRGTATYRRDAALTLVRRTLDELGARL